METAPPVSVINGWFADSTRNQFHDVIPGSSINQVYKDSDEHYAQIMSSGKSMLDQVRQV